MANVRTEWLDIDHRGHDFALKGGEINPELIRQFCKDRGLRCTIYDDVDSLSVRFSRRYTHEVIVTVLGELKEHLGTIGYMVNPEPLLMTDAAHLGLTIH